LNIWTAFFLVLSVVILASPLLSSSDTVRNRSDSGRSHNGRQNPEDNELELDLASGRLALEDYEAMTGIKADPESETVEGTKGNDGSLSEG
jgi:hypothetical protein